MSEMKSFWDIIEYPVATEKVVKMIEIENKIVFQLKDMHLDKSQVKASFEKEFNASVDKINLLITRKGKKRAIIKLKPDKSAGDIAVKLGII